jgi:tetratricopeptide (TPR) repeat protein
MSQATGDRARKYIVVEAADPRLHVMISSTTVDLPEHRHEVSEAILRMGHFPVMMELGSAEWNSDAIRFSLEKVAKSQVYIGVFALRYGYIPDDPIRNPDRLSMTELEYRHAKKLGIPALIYLADKSHAFGEDQIDFDLEKREKLNRIKKELGSSGFLAYFRDPAHLRSLVLQSLHELRVQQSGTVSGPSPAAKVVLPAPPEVYAVPEYKLTNTFIGRSLELDRLDGWAKSSDSIIVVDGIGGQGKSAVTWEWMQRRAPMAISSLAGRIWWSFYERGASMVTFVRHALAYVTGQDPESLINDSAHYERGQRLLRELRRKPFLLVLDGFERVLTAYHRLDKAQIPDDRVDSDLRDCVSPADGELLSQLLGCGPSRILITTRLFPKGLEDRGSHGPIPGVVNYRLDGLTPPDALELMRQAGVKGQEDEMLSFADQFGRHSLLLRIVCGMIADYRKRPYDFDAWRADPSHGGGIKLSKLDLKQRHTHILHYALRGLDDATRKLLSRIAVIFESPTYDTLAVLNPFSPPRPARVERPKDPPERSSWSFMRDEARRNVEARHREREDTYRRYEHAMSAYFASMQYREGVARFDEALKELEERGLLHWDRDSNRYEMHPVVRGYAAELLNDSDRTATFLSVRDHFAGLPPDKLDSASELEHVAQSLEIYRCLVGAGKLNEAVDFYRGDLSNALYYQLGAYWINLELLKPLFRTDPRGLPSVSSVADQAYILNELATVYAAVGREEDALATYWKALRLSIEQKDWNSANTVLRNTAVPLSRLKRYPEEAAVLALAGQLAEAAGDQRGLFAAKLGQMIRAVTEGRFGDAEALSDGLGRQWQYASDSYLVGETEFWQCLSKFYQGALTEEYWRSAYDLAVKRRSHCWQHHFLALRAEWELSGRRSERALDAIEQAL